MASVASDNLDNESLRPERLLRCSEEPLTELQRRVEGLEKGIEVVKQVVTQSSLVCHNLSSPKLFSCILSQNLREMRSELRALQNQAPDTPPPVNMYSRSITINMDSNNIYNLSNSNSNNDHSIRSRDHLAGNSFQTRNLNQEGTSRQSIAEKQGKSRFESSSRKSMIES